MSIFKRIITLCTIAVFCGVVLALEENPSYPAYATFNQNYYVNDKFDEKYFGSLGALTGTIMAVEEGPQNRSVIKIKLEGSKVEVWLASTIEDIHKKLETGHKIDVLGFFDKTELEPEYVAKLSNSREYLIGFCFINRANGPPLYFHHVLDKCLNWENGTLAFDKL